MRVAVLRRAVGVVLAAVLAGCGGTADIVVGPAAEAPAIAPVGTWKPIAVSPLQPRSAPFTVWTGQEVLVAGGFFGRPCAESCRSRGVEIVGDAALYDPVLDQWRAAAVPPHHVVAGTPAAVVERTVYVLFDASVVGNAGGEFEDQLWSYAIRDNRWRQLASPVRPLAPWSLRGIVATRTGLFTWAGFTPGGRASSDQLYDIATDRWRAAPRNPRATDEERSVTSTPDGQVVSVGTPTKIGGKSRVRGAPRPFVRASVLDPGALAWRQLPDANALRDYATGNNGWGAAAGLVVKPLVAPTSDRQPHGKAKRRPTGAMLDPLVGTWTPLPARPEPASGTTPFVEAQGWGGDFAILRGWALDVAHRRWFVVPQIGAQTYNTSVAWTGRSLFAWGGTSDSGTDDEADLTTGWVWTPDSHVLGDLLGDS